MRLEDFRTYIEFDDNSHISKTANHIDFFAYRNEDAYVYKDMGVDHFGNFEHKIDVKAISATVSGQAHVWTLANLVDDFIGIEKADDNALTIFLVKGATYYSLYLRECYLGDVHAVFDFGIAVLTWHYLTIKRYGTTLTCKRYSDSARTNLSKTLTLTLNAGQPSHRYIYASQTSNDSWDGPTLDCDVENLDLQEAPYLRVIHKRIAG